MMKSFDISSILPTTCSRDILISELAKISNLSTTESQCLVKCLFDQSEEFSIDKIHTALTQF
jgi:hypothetical protein